MLKYLEQTEEGKIFCSKSSRALIPFNTRKTPRGEPMLKTFSIYKACKEENNYGEVKKNQSVHPLKQDNHSFFVITLF